MAAFARQWEPWVVATDRMWPTKPEIFTVCPQVSVTGSDNNLQEKTTTWFKFWPLKAEVISTPVPPSYSKPTSPFIFLLWSLLCSPLNSSDLGDYFIPSTTIYTFTSIIPTHLCFPKLATIFHDAMPLHTLFWFPSSPCLPKLIPPVLPSCDRQLHDSLLCGTILPMKWRSYPLDHMVFQFAYMSISFMRLYALCGQRL